MVLVLTFAFLFVIEILGIDRYIKDNPIPGKRFTIKKKEVYARILVQKLL